MGRGLSFPMQERARLRIVAAFSLGILPDRNLLLKSSSTILIAYRIFSAGTMARGSFELLSMGPFLDESKGYHWPSHCFRRKGRSRDQWTPIDRKSTRLNSSHGYISYAVFCLKKKILA